MNDNLLWLDYTNLLKFIEEIQIRINELEKRVEEVEFICHPLCEEDEKIYF